MSSPLRIVLLALALSSSLAADETRTAPAQFDQATPPADELYFIEDAASLKPNRSVFEVETQRFLSTEEGQRYALVTFRNSSSAVSIDEKDVVGILANGERLNPTQIEGENRIQDIGTVLLHFGLQTFPLVKIETRN